MRRQLLAVIPAGAMVFSLAGCGNNASANRADDVQRLSERYALVQKTGLGLADQDRVYTATLPLDHAQALGPIPVPADPSPLATRVDELNAMRGEILTAHDAADTNPSQKAVLARMLAEIDMANAHYLGNAARTSYEHTRSGVNDLQQYADQIDAFEGVITIYEGDRSVIIDTLETGDAGGGMQIDGIQQLTARASSIQDRVDRATAAYQGYEAKAEEFATAVMSHEQEELELKTQARTRSGEEQFELLDLAVEEWLKARLAEIESEYNLLLADVQQQNAELSEAELTQVQDVMSSLRDSIARVQSDIDALSGEIRVARQDRNAAADALSNAFDSVEARMTTLVFARLDRATVNAESAVGYYSSITATGQARSATQQNQLNAMLMQLQLMQHSVVVLSGYKSAIDTLAANGDDLLGANLADSLAGRSAQLTERIQQIKLDAAPIQDAAAELVTTLTNSASDSELLAEQSDHLTSIRQGLN